MAKKPPFGTGDWHKNSPCNASDIDVPGLWKRGKTYWYRPPMREGFRPKPFSLETSDKSDAIRQILKWRATPALHEEGRWEDEVERYIREMLATKRLGRFYASSRRYVLLAFGVDMSVEAPRQATESVCRRWYEFWKAKNKNTAKHYIVHLRVFLDWLLERRVIATNPAKAVVIEKVKQKVSKDFVASGEVRRQLAAARIETKLAKKKGGATYEKAREVEFMLFMGYDAGLRKNEMIEARKVWFDMTHGHGIHVSETATYTPKDLEDRTVPLTDRFKRFLKREYPKGLPAPWVLRPQKERVKQLYRFEPKKGMAGFMERCEAKSINGRRPNLHMFRHSFASNRLLDGVSIFRVAKWLGDDIETAMKHYGHLLPQDSEINKGV